MGERVSETVSVRETETERQRDRDKDRDEREERAGIETQANRARRKFNLALRWEEIGIFGMNEGDASNKGNMTDFGLG